MEKIAGLAKTAEIGNLSEFLGVGETFFKGGSAMAKEAELEKLTATAQQAFFTDLAQVSAKEGRINGVLKLSAAELGEGASLAKKNC